MVVSGFIIVGGRVISRFILKNEFEKRLTVYRTEKFRFNLFTRECWKFVFVEYFSCKDRSKYCMLSIVKDDYFVILIGLS